MNGTQYVYSKHSEFRHEKILMLLLAIRMGDMTIFRCFRVKAYRKNVLAKCVSEDCTLSHLTNIAESTNVTPTLSYI